jgi:hypothetical protein
MTVSLFITYYNSVYKLRYIPLFNKTLLFPSLSLLLPATYAFYFLMKQNGATMSWAPIRRNLLYVCCNYSMLSFSKYELLFSGALLVILGLMVFHKDKRILDKKDDTARAFKNGLFMSTVIYLLLIIVMPYRIGDGWYITHRIVLFFYVNLILWLAFFYYETINNLLRKIIITVVIFLTFYNFYNIKIMNIYIEEYVNLKEYIKPHSLILPIRLSSRKEVNGKQLNWLVDPFLHATSYIALENNIITLDNYEADTSFFPTYFHDKMNPYKIIGDFENNHDINIESYFKKTGYKINYIITCGSDNNNINKRKEINDINNQLNKEYTLLYKTVSGLAKIYELNLNKKTDK